MTSTTQVLRTLPWGEEIYKEFNLNKKSLNKFYARHGKNTEGREYIEFSKFGPMPNNEEETYRQKLRIYSPLDWAKIKHFVEEELSASIGWDLTAAEQELESALAETHAASTEAK